MTATLATALCCFGGLTSMPAHASSSDWFETEGARIRLVTSGAADADGILRGILDVELGSGWKTYWRDPGETGVPPSVDVSASTNVTAAELRFPPPQRHDEGDFLWAGYDHSVAFPIAFELAAPGDPVTISADVFLGICETICVPVQANLSLDPASDPDNPLDEAAVRAAESTLPGSARPDFGVQVISKPGDTTIVLEAALPENSRTAELFIAGDGGYAFATPRRVERGGKTLFEVEAMLPARLATTGPGLHYTLVTEAGAVSGLLPYF